MKWDIMLHNAVPAGHLADASAAPVIFQLYDVAL